MSVHTRVYVAIPGVLTTDIEEKLREMLLYARLTTCVETQVRVTSPWTEYAAAQHSLHSGG